MPPRRKPASSRKKKADTQLKRAAKRGVSASLPVPPTPPLPAARLHSAFISLPPTFLHDTKLLASTRPVARPITASAAVIHDTSTSPISLSCPRRPKWRFDMTKKEVECNEEGVFKQWLAQTDQLVQQWQLTNNASPTYYERNLEVWRQLWRVSEISDIILVLLDSRCPLLHYPPSLSAYLSDRRVILVLTKVDIAGPLRSQAWISYFRHRYPDLPVVQVESYIEKEARAVHQGRRQFDPHIPQTFKEKLIETIKQVHDDMLQPSEKVKANPKWLANWKPPVKRLVDWDAVLTAGGDKVGSIVGGALAPRPKEDDSGDQQNQEPEFLTIGLIGQPNVGKSSLLNALFGSHKVRASKTPGKTKHFQTLFWTSDVRLVDCPGLVMPNFVPMETQVLSGILPISRVSAVPACIHYAAELLPLERIYNLTHPVLTAPAVDDRRTWRDGMKSSDAAEETEKAQPWTAMDILTAYADVKGWVTAKAGRPDVHRAGNAILRALAEGKVGWAFWPPGIMDLETLKDEYREGSGIWMPRVGGVAEESDESEVEDEQEDQTDEAGKAVEEEEDDGEDEEQEEEETLSQVKSMGHGRFDVLMDEVQEESEEDEEE